MIGVTTFGKCRDENLSYEGEISSLYVMEEYQGQGIGRRLVKAAIEELVEMGNNNMIIWALADNPYRKFYEKTGGKPLESKMKMIGDKEYPEVGYIYEGLRVLIQDEL